MKFKFVHTGILGYSAWQNLWDQGGDESMTTGVIQCKTVAALIERLRHYIHRDCP